MIELKISQWISCRNFIMIVLKFDSFDTCCWFKTAANKGNINNRKLKYSLTLCGNEINFYICSP